MILSQGTETIMLFTDRLFLSKLSLLHMSSAMTGGLASFVVMALFLGITGYVNTLVAHGHGAGKKDHAVFFVGQGMWVALFAYPVLVLTIPVIGQLFALVGHAHEQIQLESSYFSVLILGSLFALLRSVFSAYFTGIGKTSQVLAANTIGMIINIPLNIVLIFGFGPIPAMGIIGAALGTLGGSLTALLILFSGWVSRPEVLSLIKEKGLAQVLKLRRALMVILMRFGAPAGLELFLNVFAFNLFLQLMHAYGEKVGAAVTITFNFDLLAFIPMLGMGIAVSALVGQEQGAQRPGGARKVARMGMRLGLIYAGSMALVFLFGAPWLVSIFVSSTDPAFYEVRSLAETMLRMAAIYTLADAIQVVFGGVLRGAGDTRWVMFFSASVQWLMAFTALVGILWLKLPPLTIWTCFIIMILVLGTGMILRYKFGGWEKINILRSENS